MDPEILLRPAAPGDLAALAGLFPELATGENVPPRETWEREILGHTTVAVRAGAVVAYCYAQAHHAAGHVRHLVVSPAERGKKLGLALMRDAAERFQAAGCARWMLNVKPENTAALRLYEGLGMRRVLSSTGLRIDWERVEKLPAPALAGQVRELSAEHHGTIERALGLLDGQLATIAAAGTRVMRWIEGPAGEPLAFGAFDPAFPGAMPFRAASPDQARPLLEAFRPHARPGQTFIQLFIEGDPALTAVFCDAGAEIRMKTLRLEGPLPLPG
ncbi:MAG: GNAT family N-acetyltransferase [Byssovorax sp.]